MKHSIIMIFILLLFLNGSAVAQSKSIHLEGKIDASVVSLFDCTELLIQISDPAKKLSGTETVLAVPLNTDGRFKTKISTQNRFTYLSFWAVNHKSRSAKRVPVGMRFPYLDELYLFEQGDSISLNIKEPSANYQGKRFFFAGKGAEKLNFQFSMHILMDITDPVLATRKNHLSNAFKFDKALYFTDKFLKTNLQMRLQILESYEAQMSPSVYNLLYADVIGNAQYPMIRKLSMMGYGLEGKAATDKNLILQNYYQKYLKEDQFVPKDSISLTGSAYYLEYLFEKEWHADKLYSKEMEKGTSFEVVYERIKQKYIGLVRDQLILIAIRKLNGFYSAEIKSKLNDVFLAVKDSASLAGLRSWNKQQNVAYPFELEDMHGNVHKLSDYRGKVVIIDFWFTGCAWCSTLNAAMHSIIEKYHANKEVVFITICQDKDKAQWLSSLASGKYTSAGNINLYTNGLGSRHPILKYYNFFGAPQQLIINKNGTVVSTAPPRPDAAEFNYRNQATGKLEPNPTATLSNPSAQEFIKIINSNL